jgi:predicted HicB family RNase H-like nuclease
MKKAVRTFRFNMRVPPAWRDRVKAAAERLGISMADFVIMVVNERLAAEAAKGKGDRKN